MQVILESPLVKPERSLPRIIRVVRAWLGYLESAMGVAREIETHFDDADQRSRVNREVSKLGELPD